MLNVSRGAQRPKALVEWGMFLETGRGSSGKQRQRIAMTIANICGPPGVLKTQTLQKHYVLTATQEAAVGKRPVMGVKDDI